MLLWKIPVCAPLGCTRRLRVKGRLSINVRSPPAWKEGKRNVFGKLKLQGACGPEEPDEGVVARETHSSKKVRPGTSDCEVQGWIQKSW